MPAPKRSADRGEPSGGVGKAKRSKRAPREQAAAKDGGMLALSATVTGDAPWPPCIYVKAHVEEGAAGAPRAAFVTGLPPTWRPLAEIVRSLAGACGEVETVVVAKDESSAIVSFTAPAGLAALLAAAKTGTPLALDLPPTDAPFGLKAWVEAHKARFPGNDVLRDQLDAWVAAYETEEDRRKAEAAAAAENDGWTVVVRHGGRKKTAGGGVSVGAVAPAAAAAALEAKKAKLDADFYRFQRREAKRNELAELRAKFEEDKKKVAALREGRRFRPQ